MNEISSWIHFEGLEGPEMAKKSIFVEVGPSQNTFDLSQARPWAGPKAIFIQFLFIQFYKVDFRGGRSLAEYLELIAGPALGRAQGHFHTVFFSHAWPWAGPKAILIRCIWVQGTTYLPVMLAV